MSNIGQPNNIDKRAQPSGTPNRTPEGGTGALAGPDGDLLALHARLCELEPDADVRAKLLRVPANVDAAWQSGRMLPVLRAQRRLLESVVAQLERTA